MSRFIVTATRQELDTLQRMLDWIRSFSGTGANSPYGAALAREVMRSGVIQANPTPPFMFIRLTGQTATGVNDTNANAVQWTYDAVEVEKTATGYGGWTTKTDGWTGTAHNFAEDINTGSGTQGNGVNHDGADYPSTFDMSPVPTDTVVPAVAMYVGEDQAEEAWFWPVPNGEDGTCG